MANIEETEPTPPRKKTRKRVRSEGSALNVDPPLSKPSPTDRIDRLMNVYSKSIEKDNRQLVEKVHELQAMVNRLAPENARLAEAHGNAVFNNITATVFVAIGGGSISFATFVEGASRVVAWAGVALLMAGVVILIFATLRGRATKPVPPS
jgi:DNA-binding transcriptional regulator YbjK